jgi:serine/threonine protein kinase
MEQDADIITDKDPEEEFLIIGMIGKGSYGEVYQAIQKATGNTVAVKKCHVSSDLDSLK